MRKRRVVFVGNCQASALRTAYADLFSDRREEEVRYFDDLGIHDAALREALADADTIVAIERDFDYGLRELEGRPGVAFHGFPMVVAGFVWPFATEPHIHNVPEPPVSDGPFPTQRSDSFLNRLIAKGVAPEDALDQYLALDVARVAHVDRFREIYLDQQRARDARTGFDVAGFVDAEIGRQSLFMSPHHPNAPLFRLVARQLFERMGIAPTLVDERLQPAAAFPYAREELPIHPAIVRHFGMSYVAPGQRYRLDDDTICTFEDYVLKYMRFEHNPELPRGIFHALHDPARALAHLEPALARSPQSDRGWRSKGFALEQLGRHDDARDAYRRSTELAPEEVDGWIGLARSLMAVGDRDGAVTAATRAVAVDPAHAFARQALAEVLSRVGEPQAAVEHAEAAARLLPNRAELQHQRAIILMQAGRVADAAAAAELALAIEPDGVGHANLLAEIDEEQGRRDEALALLDATLARGLFNDQTFSLLGHLNMRRGDLAAAEAAFARGSELFGHFRTDLAEGLAEVRRLRLVS